jgi:membrane protease YdiL (CAAX protease family)
MIAVCFGLYWLLVRLGEGRDAQELAPGAALGGLAIGAGVGIGMFCVVMAALVASGAYQLTGPHPAPVLADVNMALSSGFLEELFLRAIIFRLVMRAFGVWPALLFSAALFGAGHLANPNATPMAAIAIAIEAGLSLAALYLATGRVWAAIGFHVAWNFVQAYVFGARVSGIEMKGSLWTSTVNAGSPEWLSGGAFGPEASAPAMVAGTLVAIAALVIAQRRGNLRALRDPVLPNPG